MSESERFLLRFVFNYRRISIDTQRLIKDGAGQKDSLAAMLRVLKQLLKPLLMICQSGKIGRLVFIFTLPILLFCLNAFHFQFSR